MKTLRLKLLRDIKESLGTFFALCLIIAVGLCVFVAMHMTMDSLNAAIDEYYEEYRFGDAFAAVEAIPLNKAKDLLSLEGIAKVTARFTKDERVLFDGNEENIYVRLLSYDLGDPEELNYPHVFEGFPLSRGEKGIYLSPGFAQAHGLSQGSCLPVLINGRRRELTVLGIAQSPEYIYAVSGASDIFPNPSLFGVAMVPKSLMDELYNSPGVANQLSFALEPGYEYAGVEVLLKDRLKKYGLSELVPRKDQISEFMLNAEVTQLDNMGKSLPILLLFISAVIMLITLKRRVESQRGQIGIMLAFGYAPVEVLWHYVTYGLCVGAVGGALGTWLGVALLDMFVDLYKIYFIIPGFVAAVSPGYLVLSPVLAVLSSGAACAVGCREVMRLHPAEAMRPPAPPIGRRVFLEQIPLFWNTLTTSGKMAVRNMVRSPFRSMVSLLGVSLVFALMAVVFAMNNMMDLMITDQFKTVEVYDAKISFKTLLNDGAIRRELSNFEGVKLVETVLEVPAELKNQNLTADTVVMGLSSGARLYNILGADRNLVGVEGGAVLSETLAKKLSAGEGSVLYVSSPYFRKAKSVIVRKVIPQYLGSNLYLEKEELWELLGKKEVVSSAMLLAPPETVSSLKSTYRLSPKIMGISRADESFVMMTDYMDSYIAMIYIMGIAVGLVGFVIVYNSAVISFSERSRELASLLVLGMQHKEASQVVSFEQWILSAVGMAIGVPLSFLMNAMLASSLQNDVYAMPADVPPEMLLLSFVVTCAYLYLAQARIAKKMKTLRIVDVLKERE